jgi:fumarylacetoacetase
MINETHDPKLRSWVESANDPGTDFPIQNLPWCRFDLEPEFELEESDSRFGIVIGDHVLDVQQAWNHGLFGKDSSADDVFYPELRLDTNGDARTRLRTEVSLLLRHDRRPNTSKIDRALFPLSTVRLRSVGTVQNYTDFYASIHHATTVGSMFRPDNPILPNYRWVPIGYHGRASSIVVSGTEVRRPNGQQAPPENDPKAPPSFGPCKMLDYELEIGAIVGPGNGMGEPIPVGRAREHIFGLCLVNDWSARDIQKWEYQPLGPFLAKNFATSVSPFVVTLEALEPFMVPGPIRAAGEPEPLEYLRDPNDFALDITVEAHLQTAEMLKRGMAPVRLSRGSMKDMYWTLSQLIAHHTSNGCNLQPGDLLATGTLSGPTPESRGCLLELTWDGHGKPRKPIQLPSGETRVFLADGDTVIFKAYCEREGFRRIGFGECRGTVVAARG